MTEKVESLRKLSAYGKIVLINRFDFNQFAGV
jgi:hypothetical protein